uniref:Uncharacterized protein n=1 Tax=Trichuris muris TaxID=70415 RepID=A0A5S6QED9_TRIMR
MVTADSLLMKVGLRDYLYILHGLDQTNLSNRLLYTSVFNDADKDNAVSTERRGTVKLDRPKNCFCGKQQEITSIGIVIFNFCSVLSPSSIFATMYAIVAKILLGQSHRIFYSRLRFSASR